MADFRKVGEATKKFINGEDFVEINMDGKKLYVNYEDLLHLINVDSQSNKGHKIVNVYKNQNKHLYL
jgi:hypothetical protein